MHCPARLWTSLHLQKLFSEILSWVFKLNSILRSSLAFWRQSTPKDWFLDLMWGRTISQVIIHHNVSHFLIPTPWRHRQVLITRSAEHRAPGAGFSQRAGVPVLWWEGQQRRHEQMLLFISILSCVWIWLQVAKSIFSFCGRHHCRPVYFFWAPPHLLPMSCAVADVCRYQEGKQTVSLQS